MSSKTYPIPNPAAVAEKIKAAGGPQLDITKPTGEASGDGVTLSWNISDGYVTVSIVKKPFYVPESTVWSHADTLFA